MLLHRGTPVKGTRILGYVVGREDEKTVAENEVAWTAPGDVAWATETVHGGRDNGREVRWAARNGAVTRVSLPSGRARAVTRPIGVEATAVTTGGVTVTVRTTRMHTARTAGAKETAVTNPGLTALRPVGVLVRASEI